MKRARTPLDFVDTVCKNGDMERKPETKAPEEDKRVCVTIDGKQRCTDPEVFKKKIYEDIAFIEKRGEISLGDLTNNPGYIKMTEIAKQYQNDHPYLNIHSILPPMLQDVAFGLLRTNAQIRAMTAEHENTGKKKTEHDTGLFKGLSAEEWEKVIKISLEDGIYWDAITEIDERSTSDAKKKKKIENKKKESDRRKENVVREKNQTPEQKERADTLKWIGSAASNYHSVAAEIRAFDRAFANFEENTADFFRLLGGEKGADKKTS